VGVTAEPHENLNILDLMDSSNLNFDGDLEVCGGCCDENFNSNLLCTT
jgi:hypothetical protein